MRKFIFYGLAAATLSGCASIVSNFDALEIAGTYDSIITKQVVFNVFKILGNEYGIPAFVKISTQTNQVTEGANPTLTFPFCPATTLTQNAASLTTGKSLLTAGRGISLQIQASRVTNYTISPVNDPDQLRRMRSLYQYATGYMSQFDFESDYPIIEASSTSSPSPSISPSTLVSGQFGGQPFTLKIGQLPPPGPPQENPVL